jgi:hypothetical protein
MDGKLQFACFGFNMYQLRTLAGKEGVSHGPLEVVDVRVTMEGMEERIASIGPGGETTAVFTWVPSGTGPEKLDGEIIYGPGNHTTPWSHVLKPRGVDSTEPVGLFATMIVLAVVSTLLMVVVIRTRPRSRESIP